MSNLNSCEKDLADVDGFLADLARASEKETIARCRGSVAILLANSEAAECVVKPSQDGV